MAAVTGGSIWKGILEGAIYGALDGAAIAVIIFGVVTAAKAIANAVKAANIAKAQRAIQAADAVQAQQAAAQPAQTNPDLYKVGPYNEIKGAEGMNAHHVGQKAVMENLVPSYDPNTAPAINVPSQGHTRGSSVVSRSTKGFINARQVIARDIMELRRVYPDIPNSALQKLINLNKIMYGL
jgi:hypothetical protein